MPKAKSTSEGPPSTTERALLDPASADQRQTQSSEAGTVLTNERRRQCGDATRRRLGHSQQKVKSEGGS